MQEPTNKEWSEIHPVHIMDEDELMELARQFDREEIVQEEDWDEFEEWLDSVHKMNEDFN